VYFVYPETKGFELEEIVRLFDGERREEKVDGAEVEKNAIDVEHAEVKN
jgi:hypothetical protein